MIASSPASSYDVGEVGRSLICCAIIVDCPCWYLGPVSAKNILTNVNRFGQVHGLY